MTVKEAANLIGVSQMTMRLFLRAEHFGFAVKGTGKDYIYWVDEAAVRERAKVNELHHQQKE